MKTIKWNIRIDEKEYMIELEYSSILKNKIKIYVDGNHMEGVKVVLDEIGADYYLNINDNNILIYYRPIKTNVNHYRIALDGLDYETAERVKVINQKARSITNAHSNIVSLTNLLLVSLTIYLISYINNIFATILIAFFLSNIIVFINDVLETQLFQKESTLAIAISQIKEMNNKSEKAVNIITLFYPSIFATILALIIHLVYILIK